MTFSLPHQWFAPLRHLKRIAVMRRLAPVALMTGSPILCARKVNRPAEVVAVRGSGEPARLACSLARRSAGRLGAVALVAAIARIGAEELRQHLHLRRHPRAMRPLLAKGGSSARAMTDPALDDRIERNSADLATVTQFDAPARGTCRRSDRWILTRMKSALTSCGDLSRRN
jgi:hypothetical protein